MTNPANRMLAEAIASAEIVELSHLLEEGIPTFPTHSKFFKNEWLSYGDVARMNQLVIGEHSGTHVDAPSHFPIDGPHAGVSIDEVAVTTLMAPCVTVRPVLDDPPGPNLQIGPQAFLDWEEANGTIQAGDIVFVDFGWSHSRWATGVEGFAHLEGWPGLSREAAELLRDRGVAAVGTDCISLDSGDGGGGDLPAHFVLLAAGILIIENVARLEELPPRAFALALPLPIQRGTGSPLRLIALVQR